MKKYFYFVALGALLLSSCTKDPVASKKDDSEKVPCTVVINEVCGVVGYKGVELYNYGDKACSLEGIKLIKNDEASECWTGPAVKLEPKAVYVVFGKKETTELGTAPEGATSTASFSPSKSLKLVLNDAEGKTLDTFERGWTSNGNAEVALTTVEGSYTRCSSATEAADNGQLWKLATQTMGKTNKGATVQGDIPTSPAA